MAAAVLGLNDDEDNVIFEQRCSVGELEELHSFKGRPLGLRQKRAAYWEGNSNDETGRRNTRQYLETFIAVVGQYISSQMGREQLRGHLGTVPMGETASSPTGNQAELTSPGAHQPNRLNRFGQRITRYLRRHRVLVAAESLYGLTLTLSFFAPATAQEPWAWIDGALDLDGVPYGPSQSTVVSVLWWLILSWMGFAALTEPRSKFFRGLLVLALVFTCLETASHWVIYYQDTSEARGLQARVHGGNSLIAEEFDGDRSCPAPKLEILLPAPKLTYCEISGGVLHARQVNPTNPNIGMYSRGDLLLPPDSHLDYYMETRFQARDTTSIAACGIIVQLFPDLYWFFHVKLEAQPNRPDGYIGEVLDVTPAYGEDYAIKMRPNRSSIPEKWLPFVLKTSLPGSGYGAWTTLAILTHNGNTSFFVDDRLVASVAGMPTFSQAGPGVNAASSGNFSGDASCDFDYFHVQQLLGN